MNQNTREGWIDEFEKFLSDDFDKINKKYKKETHRWVFCVDINDPNKEIYDCACCLGYDGECSCVCHVRIKEITDWLLEKLSQERKRWEEEIKKMIEEKRKYVAHDTYYDEVEKIGYNTAIKDILSTINKLGE